MPFNEALVAHRYADTNGVRLHYVEAGEGPLVILLHGFPDHWYGFRHQIPALAQAGFRVVAPDLRGYNLSDKPRGVRAYRPEVLAADVAGLVAACGAERAHVVGHDWGSGVAWLFAMRYPERLGRLALVNGPHPQRLIRALRTPRQLAKSWYMLLFQLPFLPERYVRARSYAAVRRALTSPPVRPGAFTPADLERYVAAIQEPGALTAMIDYYRAAARAVFSLGFSRVDAPVLGIWGDRDPYLVPDLATFDPTLVPHARVERVPEGSHWVHVEYPERVNDLLIAFFREGG